MAIVVAEKIIEMFFIMLCGIVLFKTGLIDDKTVPKLSNILLMLVSPLMIFQSYQMDFDGHLMWGLGLTLIAALTTFTVIIILTNILIRNTEYSRNGISISSAYNLQKTRIPVEKNCPYIFKQWFYRTTSYQWCHWPGRCFLYDSLPYCIQSVIMDSRRYSHGWSR